MSLLLCRFRDPRSDRIINSQICFDSHRLFNTQLSTDGALDLLAAVSTWDIARLLYFKQLCVYVLTWTPPLVWPNYAYIYFVNRKKYIPSGKSLSFFQVVWSSSLKKATWTHSFLLSIAKNKQSYVFWHQKRDSGELQSAKLGRSRWISTNQSKVVERCYDWRLFEPEAFSFNVLAIHWRFQ